MQVDCGRCVLVDCEGDILVDYERRCAGGLWEGVGLWIMRGSMLVDYGRGCVSEL